MANYVSMTRTNYFQVTDEAAFKDLMSRIMAEGSVDVFDNDSNGKKFAFAIDGSFNLLPDDDSSCEDPEDCLEPDALYDELKLLLPDGEAAIITTIGREKLRYLVGEVIVVTNQEIRDTILHHIGISIAREMLGNPDWETTNDY